MYGRFQADICRVAGSGACRSGVTDEQKIVGESDYITTRLHN